MTFEMPDKWIAKHGRKYLCDASGLSDKSVTELVAKGSLPGIIEKGFVILTPGEYLDWWEGRGIRRPVTPIDMHRTTRKSA